MANKEPELVVTVRNRVRILRLNRPHKKNAINASLYSAIIGALGEATADPNTLIVVMTGTGDYFTSGNDLSYVGQDARENSSAETSKMNNNASDKVSVQKTSSPALDMFHKFVSSFINFPKPLIAVLNGPAVGIGVTILGLFDVVYASDQVTLHTPFATLGQGPEGCSSYIFPRVMGPGKAAEMLLFGKKITAAEAYQVGLVTEVFPEACLDQVWPRIYKWAQLPPITMISAKRLMRDTKKDFLHKVNDMECTNLEERFKSEEFFTAMMKFYSKKSKL